MTSTTGAWPGIFMNGNQPSDSASNVAGVLPPVPPAASQNSVFVK